MPPSQKWRAKASAHRSFCGRRPSATAQRATHAALRSSQPHDDPQSEGHQRVTAGPDFPTDDTVRPPHLGLAEISGPPTGQVSDHRMLLPRPRPACLRPGRTCLRDRQTMLGLRAAVAPLLGRAAGRVALDDEQLAVLRLPLGAVGQLSASQPVEIAIRSTSRVARFSSLNDAGRPLDTASEPEKAG
jgi:hypothetical protein